MSDKVYGIFCGAYSNISRVGYCTSEEAAKRYCAAKNTPDTDSMWDEYWYDELECLDDAINGDVNVGVTVTIEYERDGKSYEQVHICSPIVSAQHPVSVRKNHHGNIVISIWQKKYDKDKAEKAVRDSFFIWLAEEKLHEYNRMQRLKECMNKNVE